MTLSKSHEVSSQPTNKARFYVFLIVLFSLTIGFLWLIFYFGHAAFQGVRIDPQEVISTMPSERFKVHASYRAEGGEILEIVDRDSRIQISLVRQPRISNTEENSKALYLDPNLLFERLKRPAEISQDEDWDFISKYCSSHFFAPRAILAGNSTLESQNSLQPFMRFQIGAQQSYSLSILQSPRFNTLLLLMRTKLPLKPEEVNEIIGELNQQIMEFAS